MDKKKLKKLLNSGESIILDFKKEFYDFSGGNKEEKLIKDAKFIKDIVSFANTVRLETAYIITGFDESTREINSISSFVDDSILQEKIKDKVKPIPQFKAYVISFEGRQLGIIEIPIVKYPEPCKPIKNLKGLNKDCVYHRRGSSNSLANEFEIVDIHNWLKSLTRAEEYIGDGRIIPRMSFIEKRRLLLILILWTIFILVYIPSILYDFSVFRIVSFPYSILATYLLLDFIGRYYTRYFLTHSERKKYKIELLNHFFKFSYLFLSILIWCVVFSAFTEDFALSNIVFFLLGCASLFGLLGALFLVFRVLENNSTENLDSSTDD